MTVLCLAVIFFIIALIAAVLGTFAAWIIVSRLMEIDFVFSVKAVLEALAIATVLVLGFGMAGTA